VSTEHRLYPHGEIDLAVAPQLRQEWLAEIVEHEPDLLILDLADVTFLDAQGLALIATMHNRQSERGHRLVLTNVSPLLRRILRATRLRNLVRIVDAERLG
jgi:stage II sporulation protein AA (anti-sigma F factor antagonist)